MGLFRDSLHSRPDPIDQRRLTEVKLAVKKLNEQRVPTAIALCERITKMVPFIARTRYMLKLERRELREIKVDDAYKNRAMAALDASLSQLDGIIVGIKDSMNLYL